MILTILIKNIIIGIILRELYMKSFEELEEEYLNEVDPDSPPELYEKYLNGLNEILEQDSTNIKAIELKYYVLFCLDRFEESVETCDKILRIKPDDIDTLNFKCSNLFQLSRYKECIEICQRILDIDPKNKEALEQWESASLMSDDNSLPKPPQSLISKIIQILIIAAVFGMIIFYLLFFM